MLSVLKIVVVIVCTFLWCSQCLCIGIVVETNSLKPGNLGKPCCVLFACLAIVASHLCAMSGSVDDVACLSLGPSLESLEAHERLSLA